MLDVVQYYELQDVTWMAYMTVTNSLVWLRLTRVMHWAVLECTCIRATRAKWEGRVQGRVDAGAPAVQLDRLDGWGAGTLGCIFM